MKHLLALISLILLGPSVYYSTDFNPSWFYCLFVALASVAFFYRSRRVLKAKKAVATQGLLKTANATTLGFFAALGMAVLLVLPVGKLLTFAFGARTYPIGTPIYAARASPRLHCRSKTLLRLPDGDEYWACGATQPDMGPSVRIELTRSVFGYYSKMQG